MFERLLATFKVKEKEGQFNVYNVYGDYEISEDNNDFELELFGCSATKVVNGKEERYTPAGQSWYGVKYGAKDMLKFMLSGYMVGNDMYNPLYIDFGLQEYVDTFLKAVATEVDGKAVVLKMMSLSHIYTLSLVTDRFIFYHYEDMVIMLRTDTREVVSDNYFAENGYFESLDNIEKGEEKLIWKCE